MTYCQNCGHKSHCGVKYKRAEKNGQGQHLGEIVVCNHCRCELCIEVPWPGPGV